MIPVSWVTTMRCATSIDGDEDVQRSHMREVVFTLSLVGFARRL